MKCENCKWWDEGFCKRYPPIPWNYKDYRPTTEADDWCGEFQEKNKPNKSFADELATLEEKAKE